MIITNRYKQEYHLLTFIFSLQIVGSRVKRISDIKSDEIFPHAVE